MFGARTLAAAVLIASAFVVNAIPVELQTAARQFTGDDLLGKYDLFVRQGNCPATIRHTDYTAVPLDHEGVTYNAYAITHDQIKQEGVQCMSTGQFAIVPNQLIDAAGYRDALGETAPVVKDLVSQNAQFLVGVELIKRECGDTYVSANALAIFIEQEKLVRVPGLITLYPGARYMVVYEKDSPTPCTYFQEMPGRTIGELLAPPLVEPLPNGTDSTEGMSAEPGAVQLGSPEASGPGGATSGSTEDAGGESGSPGSGNVGSGSSSPGSAGSGSAGSGGAGSGATGSGGASGAGVTDPVPPAGVDSGAGAGGGSTAADIAGTVTEGSSAFDGTTPFENELEGDALASPEASPEDEDDGGSVCFSADSTVELEDGRVVRMDNVQLGDRVATGNGQYSPVFMFTHRDQALETAFVTLSTLDASITLTPGHYLYINNQLAAARTAKVGDLLRLADGRVSQISSVQRDELRGVYNPQTVHGDIVVDGILASTYTTAVQPDTAHSLLAPCRALFRAARITAALDYGADFLARVAPKGALVYD